MREEVGATPTIHGRMVPNETKEWKYPRPGHGLGGGGGGGREGRE